MIENDEMPKPKKAYSYIRFSSPDQARGHSLPRQLTAARDYAKEKGLELDENFTFHDLGISAHKGKNIQVGALRAFLDLVQDRTIPQGSVLLVEALDRISRQELEKSIPTLFEIVNSGVQVHTLRDKRVYRKGSMDFENMMVCMLALHLAYDESKQKSERLRKVWGSKKAGARVNLGVAISNSHPGWMKRLPGNKFKLIPERVKIVRKIFKLHLGGWGSRLIAGELNRGNVPTWGRSKAWQPSYVDKILYNGLAIGTYQPHQGRGKERKPEGEPIKRFYPAAIDEDTWKEVQRKREGGGPQKAKGGLRSTNLFQGLCWDGHSGAAMHFINKDSKDTKSKWRYLVSDQQRIDPDSPTTRINYFFFERAFLRFVEQVDWTVVTGFSRNPKQLEDLQGELVEVQEQQRETETALDKIIDAIELAPDVKALLPRARKREADLAAITKKARILQGQISDVEREKAAAGRDQLNLRQLLNRLSDPYARQLLRGEIRRHVQKIDLYPRGFSGAMQVPGRLITAAKKAKLPIPEKLPAFMVHFRNKQRRLVVMLMDVHGGLLFIFDPDAPGKPLKIAELETDRETKVN